jgi:hypothetical protein
MQSHYTTVPKDCCDLWCLNETYGLKGQYLRKRMSGIDLLACSTGDALPGQDTCKVIELS